MVQWIPDPDNPVEYIPRFEDANDMGNYVNDTDYHGRAAASPDMSNISTAVGGESYAYAYQHGSPFVIVISWGFIAALAIIALIVALTIIYAVIPMINAAVVLVHGPSRYAETETFNGNKLVKCPDGSTYIIDIATGKITSGEPCEAVPPTPWGSIATIAIIGVLAIAGGYILLKVIPPLLKKKEGGT